MSRERRPCACRGIIEADAADPTDIEKAVQAHQDTQQHAEYRALASLRGELVGPMPTLAALRPLLRRVG